MVVPAEGVVVALLQGQAGLVLENCCCPLPILRCVFRPGSLVGVGHLLQQLTKLALRLDRVREHPSVQVARGRGRALRFCQADAGVVGLDGAIAVADVETIGCFIGKQYRGLFNVGKPCSAETMRPVGNTQLPGICIPDYQQWGDI